MSEALDLQTLMMLGPLKSELPLALERAEIELQAGTSPITAASTITVASTEPTGTPSVELMLNKTQDLLQFMSWFVSQQSKVQEAVRETAVSTAGPAVADRMKKLLA